MRMLAPLAASALALSVGACSANTNTAIATGRLDCPLNSGDLTRVSAAGDGKTCVYREKDGAEVTLKLLALNGGLDATLAGLETELLATVAQAPSTGDKTATAAETAEGPTSGAAAEAARVTAEAARDAAATARDEAVKAEAGAIRAEVKADLDAHGVKVSGDSDKDEAHINLPGIHIDAQGDSANVQVGPIHINANDEASTVRVRKDVRLRGEALSPDKRGVRATFVHVTHDKSGAYSFVGYEASGRRTGPIVVGLVKAKGDNDHGDNEIYEDVKRLVRRNGGA